QQRSSCLLYQLALQRTLFPYTTLFRSDLLFSTLGQQPPEHVALPRREAAVPVEQPVGERQAPREPPQPGQRQREDFAVPLVEARSEEHTSELQSRENLVCRLLLEKKNK